MKRGNKDILKAIVESLENGNGRIVSCKAAGISFETFCQWMDKDGLYFDSEFSDAIKKAELKGTQAIKETCENIIINAARGRKANAKEGVTPLNPVWQAACWLLERKHKAEYSANQNINATITNTEPITGFIFELTTDDKKGEIVSNTDGSNDETKR
jgi:hypothetical protein